MVEKKTITSNSNTHYVSGRHIIKNKFKVSDVHLSVNILKEIYPDFNFANYNKVKELIEKEFDAEVNVVDIEKYFQPSIEALQDQYNYLINMR
jgi:hypothetical protein